MKYRNVLYKTMCCTLALGASYLISAGGAWGNTNYDTAQKCQERNEAKSDVSVVKAQTTKASGVWKLKEGQDGTNCAIHIYQPNPKVNCKHLSIKPNPSIDCRILTFGKNSRDAIDGPSVSREANLPAAKAWNSGPSDKTPNSSSAKNVHSDRNESRSK